MQNKNKRRTKIVATLGPATENLEAVKSLIAAGANIFRLNFSHGSHEEHLKKLHIIRQASEELNMPVGILQDLSGPKIRITQIDADNASLKRDQKVSLSQGKNLSNNQNIYTSSVNPVEFLQTGRTVLIADGAIALEVESISKEYVECKVTKGGSLRDRVGIAFPDSDLNLPATTEKDMQDLEWGLENQVDFIAVSFVQKALDIEKVTDRIKDYANVDKPLVIAKIEMKVALNNLEGILHASDGIMVARGDLGVEVPVEKVPSIQKDLIERANALGKPVIVATQMLHSMINSNRPTRAEVTDVAYAVESGTDAVMLSEETAIGNYPTESVEYLGKIAEEAEKNFDFEVFRMRFKETDISSSVPDAIAYAACAAAHHLNAAAIAACTETGFSAKLIAKYRPRQALYGMSSRLQSLRRMCLYWGVNPILLETPDSRVNEINNSLRKIQELEGLSDEDIAITTGGLTVRVPGATSVLEIRKFGEQI